MPGTRPGRGRQWVIAGLWLGVLGLFWGCGGDSASVSTQRPRSLEGYQLQMRSGAGDGSLPNGWPSGVIA